MKKMITCLLIALFTGVFTESFAQEQQDSAKYYRVILVNGNEFTGKFIREDSVLINLSTSDLGLLSIKKTDIKSIVALEPAYLKEGKIWKPNTHSTRYFFAPNAYGMRGGEAYYQNIMLWVNQFSVGLANNFSIGAGIIPLFMFNATSTPVWIIPKVSVPIVKDKFNIAAGGLFGTVLGEEKSGFGIAYGIATFGSRNANASFGIGYGYLSGDWARKPALNFSSFIRVSPSTYIVTENYVISGESTVVILSIGARSIPKRVSIDYGVVYPIVEGVFFPIPWFGLTIPLHKAKKEIK